MQDIGGPTKAITGFEQTLRKLETEFANLQKMGKEGISKDPSSVNSYTKAVEKAYKNLSLLGDEMAKLGKNTGAFNINNVRNLEREINQLTKEARDFQNAFAQGLRNLGIGKDTANQIAAEVRTEEQLLNRLQQELTLRRNISREAQQMQRNLENSVRESAASSMNNFINFTPGSAAGLSEQVHNALLQSFEQSKTELKKFYSELNTLITQNIRKGNDGDGFLGTWGKVVERIRDQLSEIGVFDEQQMFKSAMNMRQALETAFNKVNSSASVQNAWNRVTQADQGITELENIIFRVRDGTSSLNSSLSNVIQKENEVASATGRMAQAEQADAELKERLDSRTKNLSASVDAQTASTRKSTQAMRESATQIKKTEGAISKFVHMIGSMFSIYTIFATIRSEIRKTYEDIKTLDKSFASIAMVTDKSVQDMWSTYEQYADMASELGQKTNSVIEASALFYQQGLDTNEALELTTNTMKLATLAGENYKTATEEMTSALRGFKLEMSEGAHVTDVYSTLAAGAAASVNDIAQAMSRTASIANSAGASFENTSAFLTKMIETTQESAENLGFSENS